MAGPDSTKPSPQPYWWVEAWMQSRSHVVLITQEVIGNVALMSGLGVLYVVFRLLSLFGVPSDDIQFFKRVDLWAIKAVFLAFAIIFVADAGKAAYTSVLGSKSHRDGSG